MRAVAVKALSACGVNLDPPIHFNEPLCDFVGGTNFRDLYDQSEMVLGSEWLKSGTPR